MTLMLVHDSLVVRLLLFYVSRFFGRVLAAIATGMFIGSLAGSNPDRDRQVGERF